MRICIILTFVLLAFVGLPIKAQNLNVQDVRVKHIATKILQRLPDVGYTREALGASEDRAKRALEHAHAIVSAADRYKNEWQEFVEQGRWTQFRIAKDLPALIAGLTFRESSFRSIARLDDNKILKVLNKHKLVRADFGVMQVRAPAPPAKNCGVVTNDDIVRLVKELNYGYQIGTCVLTAIVGRYVPNYKIGTRVYSRLNRYERPDVEAAFYGVFGKRYRTAEALRARELMVLERYNWGNADLYLNPQHSSYARKIITEYEFFRMPEDPQET